MLLLQYVISPGTALHCTKAGRAKSKQVYISTANKAEASVLTRDKLRDVERVFYAGMWVFKRLVWREGLRY